MRPYPAYKDSGVEWLGEVPEGWEVRDLKHLCHVFPSNVDKHSHLDETPVQLCNYTDVYYNDRITASMNFMDATATDAEIAKFSLRIGDVIFTKDSETADDIGIAAIVSEELPGVICGYHLSIARPNEEVDGRFIKAFFDSAAAKGYFAVSANGLTRVGLGQAAIDNLQIALPPLPEQQTIAGFLDRETAKIDGLIEEQRRLIALLAEKRQATISHAVTRGLNPDARLKPSGVEWLGDIPEGWEVVPLKRLGRFAAGAGFPHEEQGIEGEELPFFKVNALGKAGTDAVLLPADVDTISRDTACRLRATIFPKGSIVFAKIGAALLLGRIRTLPCEACIDNNMMGFYPFNIQHSDYIKFAMSLLRFDLISNPGTVPSLNEGQIAEQRIPFPLLSEQSGIVAHILHETAQLDALTETATTAIALLQERRSALISAAVTGKIDLRGLAPVAAA